MGYGDVVFPHCSCDSRKEGHVIASAGAASFKLQACREDGALEVMKAIVIRSLSVLLHNYYSFFFLTLAIISFFKNHFGSLECF